MINTVCLQKVLLKGLAEPLPSPYKVIIYALESMKILLSSRMVVALKTQLNDKKDFKVLFLR